MTESRAQQSEQVLRSIQDLRRYGGESMVKWLDRSIEILGDLDSMADSFDERLKVVEAYGKLAERMYRFSGLDKPILPNSGNVVLELVRRAEGVYAKD